MVDVLVSPLKENAGRDHERAPTWDKQMISLIHQLDLD